MKRTARTIAGLLALPAALAINACAGKADSAPDVSSEPLGAAATLQEAAPAAPAASPSADESSAPAATAPGTAPASSASGRPSVTQRAAGAPRTASGQPAGGPKAPRVVNMGTGAAPAAPSTSAPSAPFIAAGTSIAASVNEELNTENSHEGDRFQARLTEDVLGTNGQVLLPAGALINGRVATSHASTGPNDLAALEVEVESITADGRTLPLAADVVELQMDTQARDSNGRTAAKVGVGAAAGAVIGRIIGSDKGDAAKGAAVGAAAGAAAAIATRSGNAVVKPGARLVVKLKDPLVVTR